MSPKRGAKLKIKTANTGSYPRVGDEKGQMRLREAYHDWEVGDISDEEMGEVYRDYTKEVIREQEEAGLDVVTDGLIRWYDPLSHLGREIKGCEINGLLRFFDTNFYYRQPVVKGKIRRNNPLVLDEFLFAKEITSETIKPVITGPFTLAELSIDNHYDDFEALVNSFGDIIAEEVRDLVEAGAVEIQIDEPAILGNEDRWEIFSRVFEKISEACSTSQLDLYVYFGDPAPLYDNFQELPVDLLGLDFTYSPNLSELIREKGSEKKLGFGLIDARNTKMEKKEEVVPIIEKIIPEVKGNEVYLNPSCGLEFLPRKRAFEKLEKMVKIAEETREVLELKKD